MTWNPIEGFVLPLLLVLLLALTALAHGVLVLARRHLEISSLSARVLQAEKGAEAGVSAAEAEWWTTEEPLPLPAGEGELASGITFTFRTSRIATELLLVETTGEVPETPPVRASRVYWTADPDARAAAADAAVATGLGLVGEGGEVVSSGDGSDGSRGTGWTGGDGGASGGDGGDDEACAAVASLPPLSGVTPLPPTEGETGSSVPGLGLLDGAALRERSGPGVLIFEAAPGAADPGGSGVRVAEGDLRIPEGTVARGLFLVGGDLVLEPGAEAVGMARVRGAVRMGDGSRIVGDRCAVRQAIAHAPPLAIPIPLPRGSWLPFP